MPLDKSKSKKAFGKNVSELQRSKPGKKRRKAINTLAKKMGITKEAAKRRISLAISYSIKKGK